MRRTSPSTRSSFAAFTALLAFSVVACDPADEPAPIRPRHHIVIVGESQDDATWPVIRAIAVRVEAEHPTFKVTTDAPQTASPQGQQRILESLLDSDVNAVCVVPTDPNSVQPVLERLSSRGKHTAIVGRDLSNPEARRFYCGPSELEVGKMAGIACVRSLAGRPQTAMLLTSSKDDQAELIRRRAFRDELPAHGLVELLKEVRCDDSPIDAVSAVRAEMRKYPRTGCWVFFNDAPLRVTAADDRLLPLGCRLVLCDGNPRHLDRLRRGEIQALVTYDFFAAMMQAVTSARHLVEDPMLQIEDTVYIETETISVTELDWYEERWENWKRGRPSPKLVN